MIRWLLDDGPFGLLARHFDPEWRWPAGILYVSESVAAGAGNDRSGRRTQLLALHTGGEPCITVHPIVLGTDVADMVMQHLRARSADATRDLGEDESIALCALRLTDAYFVTMDKGAAYQALVELGPGRVASPFDLWRYLREQNLISSEQFRLLCRSTVIGDSGIAGVPRRLLGVDGLGAAEILAG